MREKAKKKFKREKEPESEIYLTIWMDFFPLRKENYSQKRNILIRIVIKKLNGRDETGRKIRNNLQNSKKLMKSIA